MSNETAKCDCTACSGHLAFDPNHAGHTITCPHCGMETVLYLPTNPVRIVHDAPNPEPAQQASNPNLRTCPACNQQVSLNAETCPHCGEVFKARPSHGVFYYVFRVVVALAVIMLLSCVVFPLFLGGCGLASYNFFNNQNETKTNSTASTITTNPASTNR